MKHHLRTTGFEALVRPGLSCLTYGLLIGQLLWSGSASAQASCPIELQAIQDAKPNKLYLFFPTVDDVNFPESGCTPGTVGCFFDDGTQVSPAKAFDIALLPSYHGTSAALQNAVRDVVTDDYCEFNVDVLATNAVAPTTFARRLTVAIGTDDHGGLHGEAQEVDSNDGLGEDYARTWAGTEEGLMGDGTTGGELSGANSTVQRWAFAIGGTAAHEAGHTYGLTHSDGAAVLPGEPGITTHIMPAGSNVPFSARAGFRRHFDDTSFGILASNVGLSLETLHNWDYTNPNAVSASSLRLEVLSTTATLTISWAYNGNLSPWINPVVSGPTGTRVFRGTTYNVFQLDFTTGQAWANGASGVVPPGVAFHVGAAFSEVDFGVPDPVLVSNVTLRDAGGAALTLHPRMVGYDAGALDASDGSLDLSFFNMDDPSRPLDVSNVVLQQLPRVLSLLNMVQGGPLASFDGQPITPWSKTNLNIGGSLAANPASIAIGRMGDPRHIFKQFSGNCGGEIGDSQDPDFEVNNCPDFGTSLDMFPSTTSFVSATVTDPNATHYDPVQRKLVVGPLQSRVFFQLAGRHPDLNRNHQDDAIDIGDGKSTDTNKDGVPDEVQQCLTQLNGLQTCELQTGNLTRTRDFIVRQEGELDQCEAQGGDFSCCPVPVQACVIGTASLDVRDRTHVARNVATDKLTLGVGTTVAGNANAFGTALLQNNSKIGGELDITGALTQLPGSSVVGGVVRPGSAAQSVLPTVAVTPGSGVFTVENGITRTLLPGNYGAVTFRARSRVTLSSGTYNFASWTVEGTSNVTLNANNGPIAINVSGNVMIFGNSVFSSTDASKVKLYSTGTNVTFQANNSFPGTIVAPFATLLLSNFVNVAGCVGGRTVTIDTDSAINGSGFVSGGKQACESRRTQLEVQRVQVQTQLDQQTLVCKQSEATFRTCTGVPAPAASLKLSSLRQLRAPVDSLATAQNGEGMIKNGAGATEPGMACSVNTGALGSSRGKAPLLWLVSLFFVSRRWLMRRRNRSVA